MAEHLNVLKHFTQKKPDIAKLMNGSNPTNYETHLSSSVRAALIRCFNVSGSQDAPNPGSKGISLVSRGCANNEGRDTSA